MPIGCCIVDKHAHICFWNQCLSVWSGLSSDAVLGKALGDIAPILNKTQYQSRLEATLSTGSPAVFSSAFARQFFPTNEGHADMVQQVTITRIRNEDPTEPLALLSITDVTDQARRVDNYKQNAKDRLLHQRQLSSINQKLINSNEYLQDFAHTVSHDLKSPLRNINNLITWIVEDFDGEISEEVLSHIDKLKSSVAGMSTLINSLLDYARAGRETGEISQFDLQQASQDVIALMEIPEHIHIKLDLHELSSCSSELLFGQVLRNLISNAIKYNDKDVGEIAVSAHVHDEHFLCISITDNGSGIEERHHQYVFQIFRKAHNSNRTDSTGVGLALVKKVVEQLGGEISLKSTVGTGSTFSFTWPKHITDT